MAFNAQDELEKLRRKKALSTPHSYKKKRSVLEDFHGEIKKLRDAGATYQEIADWMTLSRKTPIHQTNVMRYIKKHVV